MYPGETPERDPHPHPELAHRRRHPGTFFSAAAVSGCRAELNGSLFVAEGVSARRSFCGIVWNVRFAVMDTIIFAGLLGALVAIWQERSRSVVLGVWAVVTVLTAVLLNHHVTSSLGLGLSY
jgi:hypothetical protein